VRYWQGYSPTAGIPGTILSRGGQGGNGGAEGQMGSPGKGGPGGGGVRDEGWIRLFGKKVIRVCNIDRRPGHPGADYPITEAERKLNEGRKGADGAANTSPGTVDQQLFNFVSRRRDVV